MCVSQSPALSCQVMEEGQKKKRCVILTAGLQQLWSGSLKEWNSSWTVFELDKSPSLTLFCIIKMTFPRGTFYMWKKNNIFVSKAVTVSEGGPAECGSLPCCTGQSSLSENIPTHPFWARASVFAAFLSFEEGFLYKYSGVVEHLSKHHVS